jgi:DNA-binding transcriptional LysR family regulator
MQVTWIETFLAIVERGGFCAAADSLFRSQSRVSAHIASLELELGARLFDRRQRPVALTPAGHAFFDYATSAKSSLDNGAAAVRAVEQRRVGRITLGAYAGTGGLFLPSLLADLAGGRPDCRVEIVDQPASALDEALVAGTLDVAIHPSLPRVAHSAIGRESLWCERMVAVVPCSHPLARVAEVHVADLIDTPLITNDEAVALLREADLEPNVALLSDHPLTLVGCVARGLGIGVTNELALQSVPTDDAVVVEIADAMQRVVDVCWLGEIDTRSTTHALLEAIRQARIPTGASRPRAAAERVLRLLEPEAELPDLPEAPRPVLRAGRA